MKAKKYRKIAREEMQDALRLNARAIHSMFCRLRLRERMRIAWLIVKGDEDLDKAVAK